MTDNKTIKGFSGSVMVVTAISGLVLCCPNVVCEKKAYLFIVILITLVVSAVILLCANIGSNDRASCSDHCSEISLSDFQCDDDKNLHTGLSGICYSNPSQVPDQPITSNPSNLFSLLKSGKLGDDYIVNDVRKQLIVVDDTPSCKSDDKPAKCKEKVEDNEIYDVILDVVDPLRRVKQQRKMNKE